VAPEPSATVRNTADGEEAHQGARRRSAEMHPPLPRQSRADTTLATATLRQRSLSAPPSTAKTQIAHYKTTVLILHTAT